MTDRQMMDSEQPAITRNIECAACGCTDRPLRELTTHWIEDTPPVRRLVCRNYRACNATKVRNQRNERRRKTTARNLDRSLA